MTRTPIGKILANLQQYLRDNIRVIWAAFDAAGDDLDRALRWFRYEPIATFDNGTAEALVAAGQADDLAGMSIR